MMKNDERYTKYSAFSFWEKKTYYNQIYVFLKWLNLEYPGFNTWYDNLFTENKELKSGREIIICEKEYSIAGIAILKSTEDEQKICTLRVAKRYQRRGIGKRLMELSFEWLQNDKPLLTMHSTKQRQFLHLMQYYGFELEQKNRNYYNIFSTELVYNGVLPEKKILFNRLERIDIDLFYKKYVSEGKYDLSEFVEACIRCWYKREEQRRIVMAK